jgi:hypothetical protein
LCVSASTKMRRVSSIDDCRFAISPLSSASSVLLTKRLSNATLD